MVYHISTLVQMRLHSGVSGEYLNKLKFTFLYDLKYRIIFTFIFDALVMDVLNIISIVIHWICKLKFNISGYFEMDKRGPLWLRCFGDAYSTLKINSINLCTTSYLTYSNLLLFRQNQILLVSPSTSIIFLHFERRNVNDNCFE